MFDHMGVQVEAAGFGMDEINQIRNGLRLA